MSQTLNTAVHLIDGEWISGTGPGFESSQPDNGEVLWRGKSATTDEVNSAVAAAGDAFPSWYGAGLDRRLQLVEAFRETAKARSNDLALLISREVGKPLWEAKTEAAAVVGKVQLAVDALRERRSTSVLELDGFQAVTRYHPHGVLAVLGPFNFPAHLPNGHIIPAILAGNTIVFKPSEMTPAVGTWLVNCLVDSGLPKGVVNLVQGARDTGVALSHHPRIDGLLFTGSSRAGVALHENFGGQPQKILALEMGGNNPLIVHQSKNLKAAAYTIVLSAYLTAGQRCTCARRLIIVEDSSTNQLIDEVKSMIGRVQTGFYSDDPEPFMGTVISAESSNRLLAEQTRMIDAGAKPVLEMKSQRDCPALLSPGLVDVSEIELDDEELFGPFLAIHRVNSLDAALDKANQTRYGLSAGLISDSRESYDTFIHRIRAGVVNWNRQTTGASGKLPFGGCGLSGNHRPSGYFAADYCSFPVASLESESLGLPENPMTGFDWNGID